MFTQLEFNVKDMDKVQPASDEVFLLCHWKEDRGVNLTDVDRALYDGVISNAMQILGKSMKLLADIGVRAIIQINIFGPKNESTRAKNTGFSCKQWEKYSGKRVQPPPPPLRNSFRMPMLTEYYTVVSRGVATGAGERAPPPPPDILSAPGVSTHNKINAQCKTKWTKHI